MFNQINSQHVFYLLRQYLLWGFVAWIVLSGVVFFSSYRDRTYSDTAKQDALDQIKLPLSIVLKSNEFYLSRYSDNVILPGSQPLEVSSNSQTPASYAPYINIIALLIPVIALLFASADVKLFSKKALTLKEFLVAYPAAFGVLLAILNLGIFAVWNSADPQIAPNNQPADAVVNSLLILAWVGATSLLALAAGYLLRLLVKE